ncbi:MAG: hypothetical protein AB7C97_07350 [Oscillospiraceae bacterium]
MSSGIGIFSPFGTYNPYGSGMVGQNFSYGNISHKDTSSSFATVTDNDSTTETDMLRTGGNLLAMQVGGALGDDDISSLEKHNYGQPLTIVEPKYILADDDAVTGRMSNWLKANDSAELTDRDGQVIETGALTLHNGEIYKRRVREEYASETSQYSPISSSGTLGKLELPDAASNQQVLQFHVMTDDEVQEAEAKAYDMSHYSMAESFLMDLEDGTIGENLSNSVADGDALESIETFSYEAARYGSLLQNFYGNSENIDGLKDELNGVIEKSMQTFSEKVSGDIGSFFSENGVEFDKSAMADTIQNITKARLSVYQSAFQNGEISVNNTGTSIYSYMAAQGGEISADNAQFGELSYDDITRLSEAVYEFSNSVISQQDNIRYSLNTTAEQTGMVLGLAQAQVSIMDDGSSLFSAFSKAANSKINSVINSVVSASQEQSEKFKNGGGRKNGQTCDPITNADIRNVMSWFSEVEYGDTQTNLQLAINKVYDSYMNTHKSDVNYAGSNSNLFQYMPEAFSEDLSEIRSNAITDMQNYMLLNWNIWASFSNAVSDSSKYLMDSSGSAVNVTA